MTESFRFQLAVRAAATICCSLVAVAAVGYWAIRTNLDRQIDTTLSNVASIQAASITGGVSGGMEFHEWELTPSEAALIRDLNRYAQVWTADGVSLLRTRYITDDLPLDPMALERAGEGYLVWREQTFQRVPVRSLYYPLGRMGAQHTPHILQVAAPLEARNRLLRSVTLFLGAVVLLGTMAGYGGAWWLANRAVAPVHAITSQAAAIRAGSRHRIQAAADTREYQKLIHVLNGMLARLDSAFETQRQFTADASHELRSPLTALRGELELVRRRDRSPEEYQTAIDSALEEVERLGRMAEDLLTLARSDSGAMTARLRRSDLTEILSRTVERLRPAAGDRQIELRIDAPESMIGCFDADMIGRVIWNLVENAINFSPAGGRVDIRLLEDEGFANVEIADVGPGIPEEQLARIFERFFRGDESRGSGKAVSGTGLGLSIAAALIHLHGGRISVTNRAGGGTLVGFSVPRLQVTGDAQVSHRTNPPTREARGLPRSDLAGVAAGSRSANGP